MEIQDYPYKSNLDSNDKLLVQDGTDGAYKYTFASKIVSNGSGSNSSSGGVGAKWHQKQSDFELSASNKTLIATPNNIIVTPPSTLVEGDEIELKRISPNNQVKLSGFDKINGSVLTQLQEVELLYNEYSTKLIYLDSSNGWFSIPTNHISIKYPLNLPTDNLVQKFYALDINALNDSKVSIWNDTVSFKHATQNDSSQQGVYKSNIFGSLPGVYFDGNSFYNTDLSYLANKLYTIAIVESRETTSQTYMFGQDNGGTNQALHIGYRDNTTFTLAQFGNDLNVSNEGYTNGFKSTIWIVSNNSRGKEIWKNGVKIGANTNTDSLSTGSNGRLGRSVNNNFRGYFGLVATWIENKSIADIQNMFSAINATFKIY
ncbi:hypothetical protein NIES4075_57320 [Tolypothrix sp. NIES-4075]|uniref:hypothetical protein n=1 Tax=Tolypothrix sp. NIES-4075 TaxID=2005459 RepID=UPI000B5C50E2|nr:hypothetical protein [Tolypothrix sp. NIES-4075]GAX44713.1 hypothetical protein NIES4075_57320 [Tolypothrix sp. NIES-4075]